MVINDCNTTDVNKTGMTQAPYTAFTLPLGAVPARHQLSKIVRVNATKAVPCRARVSGAVPVLTRLLKRAGSARHWPGTNFLVV